MAVALLDVFGAVRFAKVGAGPGPVATLSSTPSVPPTTVASPFVTLQPTGPGGTIPGDASDPWDFYGLGAAVIAIVIVLVLARAVVGRGPSERQSRGER